MLIASPRRFPPLPCHSVLSVLAAVVILHAGPPAPAGASGTDLEVDRRGAAEQTRRAGGAAALERTAAWRTFEARHPGWIARWNEGLGTVERAEGPGSAIPAGAGVAAGNLESAARRFLDGEAAGWLPTEGGLEYVRGVFTGNGWWAHFQQSWNGFPVFGSRVSLRITPDGRVTQFTNRTFPRIEAPAAPAIAAAAAVDAAGRGLPGTVVPAAVPALAILPVERTGGYVYYLTWRIESRTADPPGHWIAFVDAASGTLLWRFNDARDATVAGVVRGQVEPVTANGDFQDLPLVHLGVSVTDPGLATRTGVTDTTGHFSITTVSGAARTYQATLAGPYAVIQDAAAGLATPVAAGSVPDEEPASLFVEFDDPNADPAARDAWRTIMVAHDYIRTIEPAFSALDYPMPIVVNQNGQCNAFWDGLGIIFLQGGTRRSGPPCVNAARVADVGLHEYGHGITEKVYAPFFPSPAMHEGFSDYYACTITDQPRIGVDFYGPGTWLRRLDVPRRFPADATGEAHNDGLILATALWELRSALGPALANRLWHFARYGHADNFDDYFVDYLAQDDDDGDIYNGTPHFTTITNTFRDHGIGDFSIHVAFDPVPDTEDTTKEVAVVASFLSIYPITAGAAELHVTRLPAAGPPDSTVVVMTPAGPSRQYRYVLPRQPEGTTVRYYFTARDTAGATVTWPAGGAAAPFSFFVGVDHHPPVIAHEALPDQPADSPDYLIRAVVTDNLDRGLGPVTLDMWRNGTPHSPDTLVAEGNHSYRGRIPVAGASLGDLIEYSIGAVDSALIPNTASDPPAGRHAFHLVRGRARDFETDNGGLIGDGDWQYGVRTVGPTAWSGTHVWATNLSGAYSNQLMSVLYTPVLDLSQFTRGALTFRHFLNSEPTYDGGLVEASPDGGGTWVPLIPDGGYPQPVVAALGTAGYSGDVPAWTPAEFDLSQFVGHPQVRFRLRFGSDPAVTGLGWSIDDLSVVERQIKARPLDVAAVDGRDGQVPLSWSPPAGINEGVNNPVIGYSVYRAPTAQDDPVKISSPSLTGREFVDDSVTNGTHYAYWVGALYHDGESPLSGPVIAYPYRPLFSPSWSGLAVTIDSLGTRDTTLVVGNAGTGPLRVNAYLALPSQAPGDVRIHLVTGSGAHTAPGGAGPEPALDLPAGLAGLARHAAPALLKLPAAVPALLKSSAGTGPALTAPPGAWDTLFVDTSEGPTAVPDIGVIESQQTADDLYFRVSAWAPWGNTATDFNLLIGMNTDDNISTNLNGEFLILAGPLALAATGAPAALFNSNLTPVAIPHHLIFSSDTYVAEFGIHKASIGRPADMTVFVYSLSADGSTLTDRAPNGVSLPWLTLTARHVDAAPGAPAALPLSLSSAGLTDGVYEAKLILDTNDPAVPTAQLPLTLTVTGLTAVVLSDVSALPGPDGVVLSWRTVDETDHAGFHVFRRETWPESPPEVRLTTRLIPPARDGVYRFVDSGAEPGHRYDYRLADLSRTGRITYHGPFTATVPGEARPHVLWLGPSQPNPARDRAVIRYGLPAAGPISLRIFSVNGRLVRTLEDETVRDAGYHESTWDGRDGQGGAVPSGVYFYRIDTPGSRLARKLLWVR